MRFITAVDHNVDMILLFCKWCEETFDNDKLTGISFLKSNDGNYLLGLTFNDDAAFESALEEGKKFKFIRFDDKEENYSSLQTTCKVMILGNFSHALWPMYKSFIEYE